MNANVSTNKPLIDSYKLNKGVESSDFISAMRAAANGVSVVTSDGKAGRHGGTVSSFCSVSADPPTMLVCLNKASRIMRAVAENDCFNVNVLSEHDSFLANRFAGLHDSEVEDRFSGIEFSNTDTGPMLPNSLVLVCSLQQVVESGSHGIFIGLVQKVVPGELKPLTYLFRLAASIIIEAEN